MKALRENLLLQFSLLALVATAIIAAVATWSLSQSLTESIIAEASAEAVDTLSNRVMSQLGPGDFLTPMGDDRYAEFDRFVQESVVSARTARIKIWNREGTVIYSNDRLQVGQTFLPKENLRQALKGNVSRELSVPKDVENVFERLLGTLIEVYVPVRFPGSPEVVGAFEIYQYYSPFKAFVDRARNSVMITIGIAGLFFYLAMVLIVAKGWATIRRSRRETEARLRELEGFNRLLQSHLAGRQKILDGLHRLKEQIDLLPPAKEEETDEGHHRLAEEVSKLASEASAQTGWIGGFAVLPDEVVRHFSPGAEHEARPEKR
jgi:hypothetical protein